MGKDAVGPIGQAIGVAKKFGVQLVDCRGSDCRQILQNSRYGRIVFFGGKLAETGAPDVRRNAKTFLPQQRRENIRGIGHDDIGPMCLEPIPEFRFGKISRIERGHDGQFGMPSLMTIKGIQRLMPEPGVPLLQQHKSKPLISAALKLGRHGLHRVMVVERRVIQLRTCERGADGDRANKLPREIKVGFFDGQWCNQQSLDAPVEQNGAGLLSRASSFAKPVRNHFVSIFPAPQLCAGQELFNIGPKGQAFFGIVGDERKLGKRGDRPRALSCLGRCAGWGVKRCRQPAGG